MKLVKSFVFLCFSLFAVTACQLFKSSSEGNIMQEILEVRKKRGEERKSVVLPNGLSVLLVSNKGYNKSAAALDVAVGSHANPDDYPGMAHFLEHMLFLGTEKYPEVGEYNKYLASHQGYSNAYTSDERTNYYFEVNNDAFEGSLDRFSQFFVAPLFLQEFVDRELNAVHSEHQKNLNSDLWRKHRVFDLLANDKHPRSKFGTGNRDTLEGIPRKRLLDFYSKYYSANQMKLVMLSPYSLDEMEKWAKNLFSSVPNNGREKLSYDSSPYSELSLPQLIHIKPVKDMRRVELVFPAPSKDEYWKSKPADLITFVVGHEGENSLLSRLKKKNLASSLSAWFDNSSYAGQFHFDIGLTDKGLKEYNAVVKEFFEYMSFFRKEGVPEYIFTEQKTMSHLVLKHKEHEEGGGVASHYAALMQLYPTDEIEQRSLLFHQYNKDDYNKFLQKIKPENAMIYLIHPDAETDKEEKYYKVNYKLQKNGSNLLAEIQPSTLSDDIRLPAVNEYIPDDLKIIAGKKDKNAEKIISGDVGDLWFQNDSMFKIPKAKISLLIQTDTANNTALNKVKTILYIKALEESLNEWKYTVGLAGLHFDFAFEERGVNVVMEGYSQHLAKLSETLIAKMKEVNIDEQRFDIIKKEFVRDILNTKHQKAYQKLIYEMRYLSVTDTIHYQDYYDPDNKIDLISNLSLNDIKNHIPNVFSEYTIHGLAYGNLEKETYLGLYDKFKAVLGSSKKNVNSSIKQKVVKIDPGKSYAYIFPTETNNYCWGSYHQFGVRDYSLNAALRIGHSIMSSDFYTNLRTKQQLGYIVHSGLRFYENVLGLLFLIQSSDYHPTELANRANQWMDKVEDLVNNLNDLEFNVYKEAVVKSLREEDKTIFERHSTLYFETVTLGGDFDYQEKVAKIAEKIDKKTLLEILKKGLDPKSAASISVFLTKKEDAAKKLSGYDLIPDSKEFKANKPIY